MMDLIRGMADDLHSAAESLKAIESMLVVLTRAVVGGLAAVFAAVVIVAVKQK